MCLVLEAYDKPSRYGLRRDGICGRGMGRFLWGEKRDVEQRGREGGRYVFGMVRSRPLSASHLMFLLQIGFLRCDRYSGLDTIV